MNPEQLTELARLMRTQAAFATAGFAFGLVMTVMCWGLAMKSFNASTMEDSDKAMAYGVTSVLSLFLVSAMVCGICCWGPDIFAPTGAALQKLMGR